MLAFAATTEVADEHCCCRAATPEQRCFVLPVGKMRAVRKVEAAQGKSRIFPQEIRNLPDTMCLPENLFFIEAEDFPRNTPPNTPSGGHPGYGKSSEVERENSLRTIPTSKAIFFQFLARALEAEKQCASLV
jgi:hypothetical protein